MKRKPIELFDRGYTPAFANVMLATVVLFLVIFMVVPWHPFHHGIALDSPRTAHATSQPNALREDTMSLTITRDGNVFFGLHQVQPKDLPETIREKLQQGAERKLYLKIDARAKYADVASVLDAIRSSPVQSLTFLTDQSR